MWPLILGGAAAIAVAGGAYKLGSDAGWARRDAVALTADLAREKGAHAADLRALEASQRAASEHRLAAERIRKIYRPLQREIPAHVSPETDARFPLPVGFVRLHDAAALGLPVADVHDPAGRTDDAASELAASEAARVITWNYEACAANAEQVRGWQAWWRGQAAALRP
ncbi:hypothetical protein [uncultured Phenylobacterium sp.]|uniref:hypothetical protein n=1 Tax=uncultured Phenylobacterium sp. TaxID=349273 RepID=UPI0025E75C7D|nr:hypothetical protein [uncultured Phenylobacterium sp.]